MKKSITTSNSTKEDSITTYQKLGSMTTNQESHFLVSKIQSIVSDDRRVSE